MAQKKSDLPSGKSLYISLYLYLYQMKCIKRITHLSRNKLLQKLIHRNTSCWC